MKYYTKVAALLLVSLFILTNILLSIWHGKIGYTDERLAHTKWRATLEVAEDGWQRTYQHAQSDIFVFSAYYDRRNPRAVFIRIVGAMRNVTRVKCVTYTEGTFTQNPSSFYSLNYYGATYTTVLISCPYDPHLPPPKYVTVVGADHFEIFNYAFMSLIRYKKVVVPLENKITRNSLASCYQPLHPNKHSLYFLYLHFETMQSLGIDKFILYYDEYQLNDDYKAFLSHYIERGIVIHVPWELFTNPSEGISVYGQYAQIADCLYRHMYDFEFIFNIDFDEIPLVANFTNWKIFLRDIMKINNNAGSFLLANSYVVTDDIMAQNEEEMIDLVTGNKTAVRAPCHGTHVNKYIAKPTAVVWPFVHEVLEQLPGYESVQIDSNQAINYHLKTIGFGTVYECNISGTFHHLYWEQIKPRLKIGFVPLCKSLVKDFTHCQLHFS